MLGNGWFNPLPLRMWGSLNLREHLDHRRAARLPATRGRFSRRHVADDRNRRELGKSRRAQSCETAFTWAKSMTRGRSSRAGTAPGFDDSAWQRAVLRDRADRPVARAGRPADSRHPHSRAGKVDRAAARAFIFLTSARTLPAGSGCASRAPPAPTSRLRYGELLNAGRHAQRDDLRYAARSSRAARTTATTAKARQRQPGKWMNTSSREKARRSITPALHFSRLSLCRGHRLPGQAGVE